MALRAYWYGKAFANVFGGEASGENRMTDWLTDTIKVMLTTDAYVPNRDTDEVKADVTSEVSGTGYTAGGKTLTGKTVTYQSPSKRVVLDAADVAWIDATITDARYAVIYNDSHADKLLLGYIDFVEDQSTSAILDENFLINWSASGIFEIVVAA